MGAVDFSRMDKRVEVQTETRATTGAFNETQAAYSTIATRWASVQPASADELERMGHTVETVTHVVKMRWFNGLTAKHQLKYGTRQFAITGTINTREHTREQIVYCKELPGNGAGAGA